MRREVLSTCSPIPAAKQATKPTTIKRFGSTGPRKRTRSPINGSSGKRAQNGGAMSITAFFYRRIDQPHGQAAEIVGQALIIVGQAFLPAGSPVARASCPCFGKRQGTTRPR